MARRMTNNLNAAPKRRAGPAREGMPADLAASSEPMSPRLKNFAGSGNAFCVAVAQIEGVGGGRICHSARLMTRSCGVSGGKRSLFRKFMSKAHFRVGGL